MASQDNRLISGNALRSNLTSLVSKLSLGDGALLPSSGILREVETLTTLAGASTRTLRNSDSGKIFLIDGVGAGSLTLTLATDLDDGAYFDFVVITDTGAGDVILGAGTGRTFQGTLNMNGGLAVTQVSTAATAITMDVSVLGVGDFIQVKKVSSTKVQAIGMSLANTAFIPAP